MFFSRATLSVKDRAELTRLTDSRPDVLVVATGEQSIAVVTRSYLAVSRSGAWRAIQWMDIQRGGWDQEGQRLHWELVDGTRGEVVLNDPGDLPAAFAERVRASILAQRTVNLPKALGSVLLVARRQPGSDGEISWQAQGLGRCDLNDPQVQAAVVDATAEFRAEFE